MESSQYQKWVNISYGLVAFLCGYIFFVFAQKVAGTYDLESRVHSIDLYIRIASIAVGGLVFAVLYFNEQANQFMNEVVVELSRVTWPSYKETTHATTIVIVMVLISGMFLGFLDYVWTSLLKWVL